jgi:hypothetical protein
MIEGVRSGRSLSGLGPTSCPNEISPRFGASIVLYQFGSEVAYTQVCVAKIQVEILRLLLGNIKIMDIVTG